MALFEKFTCSHTYWAYSDVDFNQKAYFPVLNRAFPVLVSGELLSYTWDYESQSFYVEMQVTGLEKHSTWIYYPDAESFDPESLSLMPKMKYHTEPHRSGKGLFLIIDPPGFAGNAKITYFKPVND